jgi:hypothetical protein
MPAPSLFPLNDLAFLVTLYTINPTTAAKEKITSGTVTAFLAAANTPTATAADPTLTGTVAYVSAKGRWLVTFDGAALTAALLASSFGSATPYLIVEKAGDVRIAIELAYTATRSITASES